MSPANQEAYSVMALDIGTVHTRALLFDVVEETYHFIAAGVALSTSEPPLNDIGLGVQDAIRDLQQLTGRILLNQENSLILPSQVSGEGIDRIYITYSIGKALAIATFGLMGDVSLQSINKLAATVKGQVVQNINLNDPRTIHEQIDDVLNAKPDLILFGGGTDRGASRSVKKMADLIAAILQLIPQNERPPVVFSGNLLLAKPIQGMLDAYTQFSNTGNIRPDIETEEIDAAAEELAGIITKIRSNEIDELKQLAHLCNDEPCPSANAIGRITRFLSKVGDPEKGILCIDLGAASTITASAVNGSLNLNVLPVGSAQGFEKFLRTFPFSEISQWLPDRINFEDAREQLWQKTLFPTSLPMTREALVVEQCAYRALLRFIMHDLTSRGVLAENGYETVLCSGAALTQAGSPQQLLMMLLDGIQPRGVSTFILDSNSILPTLGAIARTLPLLPVQVLESSAFTNLATVISVESALRTGSQILHVHLQTSNGKIKEANVKQGSLTLIPLRTGESAVVDLELSRMTRVEALELTGSHFKINGGMCGLIIDARGRPIRLPDNPAARGELFDSWNSVLALK